MQNSKIAPCATCARDCFGAAIVFFFHLSNQISRVQEWKHVHWNNFVCINSVYNYGQSESIYLCACVCVCVYPNFCVIYN